MNCIQKYILVKDGSYQLWSCLSLSRTTEQSSDWDSISIDVEGNRKGQRGFKKKTKGKK